MPCSEKIAADFRYERPRGPIEARLQIQKKLLNCLFPVELSMPGLQVPLQSLTDLAPGHLLLFSKDASDPAVMMLGDVRLCSATPVRLGAHRAARVLFLDAPLPTAGEL